MTTTTDTRRTLTFASLDQVMPEVDRLLPGHKTVGNWSLGQICNHLAAAVTVSVDGVAVKAPWLLRKTIAPVVLKRILKAGRIRDGFQLPEEFVPKPDLDARAEAEALRASLRLFAAHSGPVAEHPFFGRMSRDQWDQLHRIHCAHHLNFVLPADPA